MLGLVIGLGLVLELRLELELGDSESYAVLDKGS
jgi:hypothetical protein